MLGDASTANVGATIVVRNAGELADNALSAVEAADGTQIVVAIASNAVSADTVSVRVSGTGVGVEQTTVSQVLSAADVTRGYVSVALSQGLLDASGEGQKVVSAIFRNGSSEKTVAVTGFSYDPSTTTVQGTVALGPVSSGHGLKVTLYRADGSVLVSESSVGADGTFSLGFSASYKGLVLARVRDTSAGADYQDEVSGLKDLNTDLRAVFNVSGPGVVEVSITPLSELATRVLLNDTGGDGSAGYTVGANQLASAVAAINSSVSNAFGVSDVLTHVSTVLSAGYNDSAVSDAQKYARVLAKLAGLDAREGGVSNTLEVLKAQLQGSSLSAAGQSLLVDGAAIFESGSNATLSNLIASGAVLGDASTANVGATIVVRNAGELADNALSAVEAADGTQIVVAIASNAVSADTVSVRVSGTGVGVEQTTVSQVLSAADVTRGYVSVALSQGLLDASGEGQKVVSAIFRNGSSEKTVAVTGFSYDVTAPAASFLGFVASDDRINWAESTNPSSLVISGSVEPGASLSFAIDGLARSPAVVNSTWTYQLTPSDLLALGQGMKTLHVVATDAVGNTHAMNKSVLIDTEMPSISFNSIAGNDTVDLTEHASGVVVSGITNAEPGQMVSVTWAGITKTGTVNMDHSWTVASFAHNELPISGTFQVAVDVSDAVGNPATTVTKAVTIDPFLGGTGADVFYVPPGFASTPTTLTNFTRSQGDKIDLHALLNGSGCTSVNASNFLSLTQSGADAVLKIDMQGASNFASPEQTFTMTNAWSNAGGLNDTLNNLILNSVILL